MDAFALWLHPGQDLKFELDRLVENNYSMLMVHSKIASHLHSTFAKLFLSGPLVTSCMLRKILPVHKRKQYKGDYNG